MLLLVLGDPLNERKPDEYFSAEAFVAKALGWDAAVVDHDALECGDFMTAIKRVSTASEDAVYRGWMVRSENYVGLEAALRDRGVVLRTPAKVYKRAHELPRWYPVFRSLTAPSVWLSGGGTEGLVEIVKQLPPGRAVLKDWVKSMKHYWDEAAFIPDLSDEEAVLRVAERFLERRGEDFVGGIVVRSFEEYQPGEVRTWWANGQCFARSAHPDTPDQQPDDFVLAEAVATAVAGMDAPFVTVDLARTVGGDWRVIEVGDGQVSDRPLSLLAASLLQGLHF